MHIRRHPEKGIPKFLKRTIGAQVHLVGCIGAAVGLSILLHQASFKTDPSHFWGCLIFGVTAILVFGTSTIYHFLSDGCEISPKLHRWLEDFDHFAIYLFIAGSYTAFLVNVIAQPWKSILLIAIWAIAIVGIFYTKFKPYLPRWAQHRMVYTGIFLLMGWTLLIRIHEVVAHLSSDAMTLLVAGGLSYSVGAIFYATKWPRLFVRSFGFHELWHVMVVFGFAFHFILIFNFY